MRLDSPPRLAHWLLRWILSAADREVVLGDLAEEFALRIQSGHSGGSWYWRQALGSIPRLLWKSARQGRWLRTSLVAFGAYVGAGVLESVATTALSGILVPGSSRYTLLSLIIGLASLGVGGYAAARIRPGAETVLSVMVFVAVVALMVGRVGDQPFWYGLAFLVAGPFSAAFGGAPVRWRQR